MDEDDMVDCNQKAGFVERVHGICLLPQMRCIVSEQESC
jgi:hypothetical protein